MAVRYQCEGCKRVFDERPTEDGSCPVCVTKALEEMKDVPEATVTPQEEAPIARPRERVEGLCVLVCDASVSMDNPAFPKESQYPKLKLVVDAIESAIEAMKSSLGKKDTAYLAIIAFGRNANLIKDLQGKPFVKSVKDILAEHGDVFGKHLYEQLERPGGNIDRGGTNITAALSLAREIVNSALKGDMRAWGLQNEMQLIERTIYEPNGNNYPLSNVRVMIYSDGAHNEGHLGNAFEGMQPTSVLMTAFIGDKNVDNDTLLGAHQMENFANICPKHRKKGTFLIDSMARRDDLRQVFHMATGASGFCEECMKGGS